MALQFFLLASLLVASSSQNQNPKNKYSIKTHSGLFGAVVSPQENAGGKMHYEVEEGPSKTKSEAGGRLKKRAPREGTLWSIKTHSGRFNAAMSSKEVA